MKIINNFTLVMLMLLLASCAGNQPVQNLGTNKGPDLIEGAKLNVQLGVGYIKRGQYKIAKEKLELAIDQDPDNIQAYSTIALLMNMLNEHDAADDYFQQALDIDENNSWLRNSYGAFLCGIGNVEDAMVEFEAAYSDPFYETAYIAQSNAGSCLMKNGDYVRAEPLLREALRTDERLSGALLSMAELGLKTNKLLMSRAYIQRYHDANKPTAESLWIQIQSEKGLKADEHYRKYAKQLLNDFPDSAEAGLLEDSVRDDKRN